MERFNSVAHAIAEIGNNLQAYGKWNEQQQWQDVKTTQKVFEHFRAYYSIKINGSIEDLKNQTMAHDWAEQHFQERINGDAQGEDLNPGNSYLNWPFYINKSREDDNHKSNGQFSHTYMERFWPNNTRDYFYTKKQGIHFVYGDFQEMITLLQNDPHTRKAYLPIWFPEDTGKQDIRVPCTLGYLFNIRDNKLHVTYYIRSCDYIRHFNHDIYLAMRLAQEVYMRLTLPNLRLGDLSFVCESLHFFENDQLYFNKLLTKYEQNAVNFSE